MNLEVPLEMLDASASSSASAVFVPSASRIALNTADYDGSPQYYFEVVATNTDTIARNVALIDGAGASLTSLNFDPGTTNNTRKRSAAFTPNTNDTYRISLDQSTSADQLAIKAARIIVVQTNATKTRIQIPLVGTDGVSSADNFVRVDTSTSTTYNQTTPDRYALWRRDDSAFSTYAVANTFTLEAVLSGTSGAGVSSVGLFNVTDNIATPVAEASVTGATALGALGSADFLASATDFLDGKEYELRTKTSTGTMRLHRACLYVRLENVSKAEVYFRLARIGSTTISSTNTYAQGRYLLAQSNFTNTAVFHESVGRESTLGTISCLAYSFGNSDSATTGSNVTNSAIAFDSTTKVRKRSSVLALTNNNRYGIRYELSSGVLVWTHALLVVQCRKGGSTGARFLALARQ